MRGVRVTVHPQEIETPALHEHLTRAPHLEDVATVNWNVRTPPAGFLLRVRGDYGRLGDVLASDPAVGDYELVPVDDRTCYCYLSGEGPPASRALWENFTRGSLLTVPPVQWNDDGSSTFTVVGTDADVQAAVEGVPAGVRVDVEKVGSTRVDPDDAAGRLSDRQRDAVRAALAVGYYDVPRAGTTADVAAELGCSTSTAGEHLRRAEATVMRALFPDGG
jgi:hypothetical protein